MTHDTTPQSFALHVTTDPARIDLDLVYRWISEETWWAREMPRALFDRAVRGSLPFAALAAREGPGEIRAVAQVTATETVGFARAITDYATFAYISDVFVPTPWRGRGVARALMAAIVAHPDLQGLRRMVLVTRDAHTLYAGSGFAPLAAPEWYMERFENGRDPCA